MFVLYLMLLPGRRLQPACACLRRALFAAVTVVVADAVAALSARTFCAFVYLALVSLSARQLKRVRECVGRESESALSHCYFLSYATASFLLLAFRLAGRRRIFMANRFAARCSVGSAVSYVQLTLKRSPLEQRLFLSSR